MKDGMVCRGVVAKSQPRLWTWRLGGGVCVTCVLLGSCPNPNKQPSLQSLQRSYLKTKQNKKKGESIDLLLINHQSSIIIIAIYIYIYICNYPNLLRFSPRKIPLSETSDLTLQLLQIKSRDSDLPPSPIVSGHSSSTFLYSFSAAHPQFPPP